MIFRLGDDDGVYQDAGDLHKTGIQRAELNHIFNLHDDLTAGVLGGLGDGQSVQGNALMLHGAVAVLVGICSTDNSHIDGECVVEQLILTTDIDHFHDIAGFGCHLIDLAALQAGVNIGLQAHVGDNAGLAGCDVTVQLADNALRQVVSSGFVFQRQLLQLGNEAPVAADNFRN